MKLITSSIFGFGLAVSLVVAGPALAQDCVSFQGIDHCPLGDATLSESSDGLNVAGLGADGNDGVASRFAPTTHWSTQVAFPSGSYQTTQMSSISGGESTSGLIIEPVNGRYRVRANFTGDAEEPTYSVLVYREGVLQGALGGFYGGDTPPRSAANASADSDRKQPHQKIALYVDGFYMGQIDEPWWWWFTFSIAPGGGCNWGLGLNQAFSVSLPDGTELIGDEIRITEDVRGPGHYPYLGFESIETRTTAQEFTITEELAEGTR